MSENLLEKIAKIDQQVADYLRGKDSITSISLVFVHCNIFEFLHTNNRLRYWLNIVYLLILTNY